MPPMRTAPTPAAPWPSGCRSASPQSSLGRPISTPCRICAATVVVGPSPLPVAEVQQLAQQRLTSLRDWSGGLQLLGVAAQQLAGGRGGTQLLAARKFCP